MASGSYAKNAAPQTPIDVNTSVPPRAKRTLKLDEREERTTREGSPYGNGRSNRTPQATRTLPETEAGSSRRGAQATRTLPETEAGSSRRGAQTHMLPETKLDSLRKAPPKKRPTNPGIHAPKTALIERETQKFVSPFAGLTSIYKKPHIRLWIICASCIIVSLIVLIFAGITQRSDNTEVVLNGGQTYNIQVAQALKANKPLPIKANVKMQTGPYSVLGKPTLNAAFINQVLTSYNSPAAGQGQALYDLGVKYQIDPAFALAFFMHESDFGTQGEAKTTRSLGNLRCIDGAACVNTDGQTCQPGDSCYASFSSWQAGFEAWYRLIRNLYVAQWGLDTVDSIIPVYAPPADNNNDDAYIAGLKHELDTWHSGQVFVS